MLGNMQVRLVSSFLFSLILTACPVVCRAQTSSSTVERGRYLVDQMGKCGDCHTPRGAHGMPDKERWLKGSPLGFKPIAPVPGFATVAPDLTATSPLWKSWGQDGWVQFFITGKAPDGKPAAPPMPQYTLTTQDARAIVAYLKSLQ